MRLTRGVPLTSGRSTTTEAFVRSADIQFVTPTGWAAACDAGLTTVLDLREPPEVICAESELTAAAAQLAAPKRLEVMPWPHVPLDAADRGFWEPFGRDGRWATALYYRPFLDAKAQRVAAVFRALAQAPAGVVFHCGSGRDRTGLVSALLLALAQVEPQAIAQDYTLTTAAVRPLYVRLGLPDPGPGIEATLAAFATTAFDSVRAALDGLDVRTYLIEAGVPAADVDRVAHRLHP